MMDRQQIKEEAKRLVEGKTGTVFLPMLVMLLLSGALAGLSYYAYIPSLLVCLVAYMYNAWNLNYIRTGETTLDNYFSPLKSLDHDLKIFLVSLLAEIFIALWSILLIVPGIIKGIEYSMVPYLLYDKKGLKYMEYLRLSKDMMYGHRMEYFTLCLSFLGWIILCALTCGILYIWKGPYMQLTFAIFYEELKAEYEAENPGTFTELDDIKFHTSSTEDVKDEPVEEAHIDPNIFN